MRTKHVNEKIERFLEDSYSFSRDILKNSLQKLTEFRRWKRDRYCISSLDMKKCHRCCLFCKEICKTPKCWEVETLRTCAWKATEREILAKTLDSSFKTKKEEKEWKGSGWLPGNK